MSTTMKRNIDYIFDPAPEATVDYPTQWLITIGCVGKLAVALAADNADDIEERRKNLINALRQLASIAGVTPYVPLQSKSVDGQLPNENLSTLFDLISLLAPHIGLPADVLGLRIGDAIYTALCI